ncbi:MAG: alcohol dehydrogenase catalytic domain-containing protein [Clostridiales bacterium]|jgi:2-desacetyl-2-hydroxyethyl bacteriochlorophyllide A dehydrogenase|nr:alcohol dehydrogenase catalytic domain-containing protein [Clostridiales bacterium]
MITVYLQSPGQIGLREAPEPTPGPGQALLRVRAAGVCGSDIGAFRGANPLVKYPRVLGHELACEVVSVPGDPEQNPRGFRPGDAVAVDPYLFCGRCYPCSIGRTNCCEALRVLGVHVDGGMAEYFAHPADMLIRLPPGLDWVRAALAEPLAIALHGLRRASLKAGERIAISGAGPIGLLAAMASIRAGAVPIMIDPLESRLQAAQALGVRHALRPGPGLAGEIAAITGGRMAEAVMEASGAAQAVAASLEIASHAGRVVLTGWPKAAITLDTAIITRKELTVSGARTSGASELGEALSIIAGGEADVSALLTRVVPAADLPGAIREISDHPERFMKVVATF